MGHDQAVAAQVFHPDQVGPTWVTAAVGIDDEVTAVVLEQIGTGQVGANFRLQLEWDGGSGPATLVAKFASLDPQSRETGIQTLTYEREVAFYSSLRASLDVAAPHVYVADIRPGTADVVVLMEDLAPREQGDQLAGCTVADAEMAMVQAARLHGPRWGDEALWDLDWLSRRVEAEIDGAVEFMGLLHSGFVDRYREALSPAALHVGDQLMAGLAHWYRSGPAPVTVTHGDYRLDNMMFGAEVDPPLVVVDWQTPGHGYGVNDVAYFLGAGLLPEVRVQHEVDLVRRYHGELTTYGSAAGVSFDEVWEHYRRYAFSGYLMAVAASMIVGRTDRGDEMFMAMANRHAEQAIHLESTDFLS